MSFDFKVQQLLVFWLLVSPIILHAQPQSLGQVPAQRSAELATGATSTENDLSHTHIFGGDINIQGMHQQFALATARGPLPFGVTGSVQRWISGPPLDNLYTQIAQGYVPVGDKWKLVFNEIYQNQGNINLANVVVGANYKPSSDISLNATIGMGANTLYTYRYSVYASPQFMLPYTQNGKKALSVEAGLTYQSYELGDFSQISPKLNWHVSESLPMVSVGYSFGSFKNTTAQTMTGYYQPKTLNGAMLTSVVKPSDKSFLALTWYPANRNYIAGVEMIQDTFGATLHYNASERIRFSLFSQFQVTRGSGNDIAGGVSMSFNF